jgi:mono/diheme cytochrome c family protein
VQTQVALSLSQLAPDPSARQMLSNLLARTPFSLTRDVARFALTVFDPPKQIAAKRVLSPEEKKRFDAGKAIYEMTCLACHQQHGMGQEGLAPPLVESEWVAYSPERLVRIVLNGLRGPIHVKKQVFELDMPSLGVLEDEQIANVLSYVRNEWSHSYSLVDPTTVKRIREATAQREDAWTEADLEKIR